MKKRLTFKCWKCERTYTLFREITNEQELIVACPYCNAEGIVDLKPFGKKVKSVMRGKDGEELDLSSILVVR